MVKTQYVDSKLLEEAIEKSGLKTGFIVDKLGISRQMFYRKLKGVNAFRGSEVYVLCDLLNISDEMKPKIFCF